MPQHVPEIEWTEDALELRQFVFDYWGENKRAPNLAAMHAGTGIQRRRLMEALKLLQLGIVFVIDETSPNCDILKAPPFSAFPSQVEMFVDGEFHSYIGCAHEGIGVSWTPYFRGKEVELRTYDAHTLEPITLVSKDFKLISAEPSEPLILCTEVIWDWVSTDMKHMCDHTNFVLSRENGAAYEASIGRRGIYFTVEQVAEYIAFVLNIRIYDYHWPAMTMDPPMIINRLRELDVDLSPWGL